MGGREPSHLGATARPGDGPSAEELRARFRSFTGAAVVVCVAFAGIELTIALWGSPRAFVSATAITVLGAIVVGCRRAASRGRFEVAVLVLAAALVPFSAVVLLARPTYGPALAVLPLMGFAFGLAFLPDPWVRRTVGATIGWIALLALLMPVAGRVGRGGFPSTAIGAAGYAAGAMLTLLLLWQARRRVAGYARELLAARERNRRMLETSLDAVVTMDRAGRITSWTAHAEQLFGWRAEEVLGSTVAETIVPPHLRRRHNEALARYLETGEASILDRRVEIEAIRRDGSIVPVELTVTDLGGEHGFGAFIRDLVERRRMEEERRDLIARLVTGIEEERARISADIHDGPVQLLTAASLRLGDLARRIDDAGQRRAIEVVEESIRGTIRSLRTQMFELYPHSLHQRGLAAALEDHLQLLARESDLQVHMEVSRDLDRLGSRSATMAYRIVQEALTNVRKHAQASCVTLVAARDADGIRIRVSDDGRGFDPDEAGRDPEHQGLRSMFERARLAAGEVRIESRPGRGTTVEVWIPEAA
jgi:PAS domain S-box-containing protein